MTDLGLHIVEALATAIVAMLGIIAYQQKAAQANRARGVVEGESHSEAMRMKKELETVKNMLQSHITTTAKQFETTRQESREAADKVKRDLNEAHEFLSAKVEKIGDSQSRHAGKLDMVLVDNELLRTQMSGLNRRVDEVSTNVTDIKDSQKQIISILLDGQRVARA